MDQKGVTEMQDTLYVGVDAHKKRSQVASRRCLILRGGVWSIARVDRAFMEGCSIRPMRIRFQGLLLSNRIPFDDVPRHLPLSPPVEPRGPGPYFRRGIWNRANRLISDLVEWSLLPVSQ